MYTRIRHSSFSKILFGLMGLYMLNISVDTKDANPNYVPEDLSFNDQESIVEFIVEKILGYKDAFKEYDDNDTEDHNKQHIKIVLIPQLHDDFILNTSFIDKAGKKFADYDTYITKGFNQLDTPPPKI